MSVMAIVGAATSPHAWPYDAVLALPAFFWVMTAVSEPFRTRATVAAYALGPTWLLSHLLGIDLLALPVLGGATLLATGRSDD
jgi:hypothetical protein